MAPCRTIALTGGTGAIGARFLAEAVSRGHSVRVLSRQPLQAAMPGVDWCRFDLSSADALVPEALVGVEQVVHLAAYIPRDHDNVDEGMECWRANVSGTHKLIEAMASAGVKRLIQTGSANIYAPWLKNPDEASPAHPNTRAFYLSSKAAQEWCAESACRKHGIDMVTLRLSSVFGTGGSTVDIIAKKMLDGQMVELINGGRFGADFVSCNDVLAALFLTLGNDSKGTFNVASGVRSTMADISQALRDLADIDEGALRFLPEHEDGDLGFPAINIEKMLAMGYQPAGLRDGLSALVAALKNRKT